MTGCDDSLQTIPSATSPLCTDVLAKEYYITPSIVDFEGNCYYNANSTKAYLGYSGVQHEQLIEDTFYFGSVCVHAIKHLEVTDFYSIPNAPYTHEYNEQTLFCIYHGKIILNITTNVLTTNTTENYVESEWYVKRCHGMDECYSPEFTDYENHRIIDMVQKLQ